MGPPWGPGPSACLLSPVLGPCPLYLAPILGPWLMYLAPGRCVSRVPGLYFAHVAATWPLHWPLVLGPWPLNWTPGPNLGSIFSARVGKWAPSLHLHFLCGPGPKICPRTTPSGRPGARIFGIELRPPLEHMINKPRDGHLGPCGWLVVGE